MYSKTKRIQWSPPLIGKEEKKAAFRVINSGWMTQGEITKKLENQICQYHKTKYALVTNNGTSSLICALLAHDIGTGDEVIVPSFTFVASVNAILAVGAKPVLVDSDPETFNTTVSMIKDKITKKTKAIIPVDISGMSVDVKSFREFADSHSLMIIEDAAEGMGGKYKNQLIGSFGHTTVFSFHMAKIVAGIEGGCIVTNDKEIFERAKLIRSHGDAHQYDSRIFGLNFRISDIHSAIALEQLKKINKFIKHRQKLARIYKEELDIIRFQKIPDYVTVHPFMLFAILISAKKRDKLNKFLNVNGIDTRICWPPVHKQKFHASLFKNQKFVGAEKIYSEIINLPMGNGLTEKQVCIVTDFVKKGLRD